MSKFPTKQYEIKKRPVSFSKEELKAQQNLPETRVVALFDFESESKFHARIRRAFNLMVLGKDYTGTNKNDVDLLLYRFLYVIISKDTNLKIRGKTREKIILLNKWIEKNYDINDPESSKANIFSHNIAEDIREKMVNLEDCEEMTDLFVKGLMARMNNNYDEALNCYKKITDIYSKSDDKKVYIAGIVEDAVQIRRNLVGETFVNMSKICYDLGPEFEDYSKAVAHLEHAQLLGNTEAGLVLGIYYYRQKQNPRKTVELFRALTNAGNSKAQIYLARCYRDGFGGTTDPEKSVELLEELLERTNNSEAQNELGICYRDGIGVAVDQIRALELFVEASKKNLQALENLKQMIIMLELEVKAKNPEAHNILGICYQNGIGVEKNYNQAFRLFKFAASTGYSDGQNNLGLCYQNEIGTKTDITQAIRLFKLAADQGHILAAENLQICYDNSQEAEQQLSAMISKIKNKSLEVKEKKQEQKVETKSNIDQEVHEFHQLQVLVDGGNYDATNNLARCYHLGLGTEQDFKQAFVYFKIAADRGNSEAQYNTAMYYLSGLVDDKVEYLKAIEYFHLAAQSENQGAQDKLSSLISSLHTDVDNDDKEAQFILARCYQNGWGVEKSEAESVKLLQLSEENADLKQAPESKEEVTEISLAPQNNSEKASEETQPEIIIINSEPERDEEVQPQIIIINPEPEDQKNQNEKALKEAEREAKEKVKLEEEEKIRKLKDEEEKKAKEEAERRALKKVQKKAKREEERKKDEERKVEREAKEKAEKEAKEAEEKAKLEKEAKARKLKKEAEERKKAEERKEAEEKAKKEAKEKAEKKEKEKAEKEAKEKAEKEEKERVEEEKKKKAKEEAENKARKDAEKRSKKNAARKTSKQKFAQQKAIKQAEEDKKEAEEKAKKEESELKKQRMMGAIKKFKEISVKTNKSPDDIKKEVVYLNEAASCGDPEMQNTLALRYLSGRGGVQKDLKKAQELLELSANQNYYPAQVDLGIEYMQMEGKNFERNVGEGMKYLRLAADRKDGSSTAQMILGEIYSGNRIKEYPEIKTADKEARRFFVMALENPSYAYNAKRYIQKIDSRTTQPPAPSPSNRGSNTLKPGPSGQSL